MEIPTSPVLPIIGHPKFLPSHNGCFFKTWELNRSCTKLHHHCRFGRPQLPCSQIFEMQDLGFWRRNRLAHIPCQMAKNLCPLILYEKIYSQQGTLRRILSISCVQVSLFKKWVGFEHLILLITNQT